MASTAELMREIHRLRRFARDLQEQIERAPRLLLGAEGQAHAPGGRGPRQPGGDQEAQGRGPRKGSDAQDDARARSPSTRPSSTRPASKKEYDALQSEIASDRAKCAQLEEETPDGPAPRRDERTGKIAELDKTAKLGKEEFARCEKDSGARLETLKKQLAETQARLKEVEANVPPNMRTDFDRIVKGKGADAFAPVVDRGCGACRTEIIAQQYNELLMGAFVVCKSCGRILYLPERPAAGEEGE